LILLFVCVFFIVATGKHGLQMKKQGYNARLDDSMGMSNGKKGQSMGSRRAESKGMEKAEKATGALIAQKAITAPSRSKKLSEDLRETASSYKLKDVLKQSMGKKRGSFSK
jgi:hypothetical protein